MVLGILNYKICSMIPASGARLSCTSRTRKVHIMKTCYCFKVDSLYYVPLFAFSDGLRSLWMLLYKRSLSVPFCHSFLNNIMYFSHSLFPYCVSSPFWEYSTKDNISDFKTFSYILEKSKWVEAGQDLLCHRPCFHYLQCSKDHNRIIWSFQVMSVRWSGS